MKRLLFTCSEISYANERIYIVSLKQSPMESHCMDHSATYIFTLYSTLENFPHLCKDQHRSLKWPYSISLCGWIIIFLTCSLMTNMFLGFCHYQKCCQQHLLSRIFVMSASIANRYVHSVRYHLSWPSKIIFASSVHARLILSAPF